MSHTLWDVITYWGDYRVRTRSNTILHPTGRNFYTYLGDLLLQPTENQEVKYLDGDFRNNRRSNLQLVQINSSNIYEDAIAYKAKLKRNGKTYSKNFPLTPFGYTRALKWVKEIKEKVPHGGTGHKNYRKSR